MIGVVGKVSRAKDHQLCIVVVIAIAADFDQGVVTLGYLISEISADSNSICGKRVNEA